jgi:RNA polymerase sigma-70 factor (ECF subfamily)
MRRPIREYEGSERARSLRKVMADDSSGVAPVRVGHADLRSLYEFHVRDVYRFVHRRCGDRSLAEEITQDVFLTAVHGGVDVSVGWLYVTARNRLIDHVRRQRTYRSKLRLVHDGDRAADDALVADRIRIEHALGALSTLHRTVLMLHYVDDLSVAQLASELGRSEKGAEALITRARAALRTELGDDDERA